MKEICLFALALIPISAHAAQYEEIHLDNVFLAANDTLAGKSATTLYIGKGANSSLFDNHCTLTVTTDYFVASKGKLLEGRGNNPEFKFTCLWNNKKYSSFGSAKELTEAAVTFIQKDDATSITIYSTLQKHSTFQSYHNDIVHFTGLNIPFLDSSED